MTNPEHLDYNTRVKIFKANPLLAQIYDKLYMRHVTGQTSLEEHDALTILDMEIEAEINRLIKEADGF